VKTIAKIDHVVVDSLIVHDAEHRNVLYLLGNMCRSFVMRILSLVFNCFADMIRMR
jgi:hypothetical protein